MYKSSFGNKGQVSFTCPEQYYELIGYLAKSDGSTSLEWEHNEDQGAWASEGRIYFYTRELPTAGNLIFTAGRGNNIYKRTNCNDFIEHIRKYHKFIEGKKQDIELISSTIPDEYIEDFKRGLHGKKNINDIEDLRFELAKTIFNEENKDHDLNLFDVLSDVSLEDNYIKSMESINIAKFYRMNTYAVSCRYKSSERVYTCKAHSIMIGTGDRRTIQWIDSAPFDFVRQLG